MHPPHRLSSRSVWAQFSRRQGNPFAFGNANGKRAGDHPGSATGFGSTEFGTGSQDNPGSPGGGGDKGSTPPPGSKNICQGFPQPPFCAPPPHPVATTKPNVSVTSRTSKQTTTQPQPSPVAGSNSTAASSPTPDAGSNTASDGGSNSSSDDGSNTSPVSPAASSSPSSGSQVAAAGNPNSTQNSDTANNQIGSTSSFVSAGQVSTSLNPSGLPFGADPTNASGVGAAPSNTARAGSGIGSTNAAASQGPDVGAIAGGVIGTISFVLLLLFVVWLIRRRQKNRTAPSAEFLSDSRYPFTGSSQFQFQRNNGSQYDMQSQNNVLISSPTNPRGDTPRSFLHLHEKSDSS